MRECVCVPRTTYRCKKKWKIKCKEWMNEINKSKKVFVICIDLVVEIVQTVVIGVFKKRRKTERRQAIWWGGGSGDSGDDNTKMRKIGGEKKRTIRNKGMTRIIPEFHMIKMIMANGYQNTEKRNHNFC